MDSNRSQRRNWSQYLRLREKVPWKRQRWTIRTTKQQVKRQVSYMKELRKKVILYRSAAIMCLDWNLMNQAAS